MDPHLPSVQSLSNMSLKGESKQTRRNAILWSDTFQNPERLELPEPLTNIITGF